jgi:type I restriction enzyme R subunit
MVKKSLSERDICTKFITPALEQVGWDVTTQVREEFPLTKGASSFVTSSTPEPSTRPR